MDWTSDCNLVVVLIVLIVLVHVVIRYKRLKVGVDIASDVTSGSCDKVTVAVSIVSVSCTSRHM